MGNAPVVPPLLSLASADADPAVLSTRNEHQHLVHFSKTADIECDEDGHLTCSLECASLSTALCPCMDGTDLTCYSGVLGHRQWLFLAAAAGVALGLASILQCWLPLCSTTSFVNCANVDYCGCNLAAAMPNTIVQIALAAATGSCTPRLLGNAFLRYGVFPRIPSEYIPWLGLWATLPASMALVAPTVLLTPLATLALCSMSLLSGYSLASTVDAGIAMLIGWIAFTVALLATLLSGWITLISLSLLPKSHDLPSRHPSKFVLH